MDYNIPSWTEEALWRRMSPKEFLNDRRAQDLTCGYKITKLLEEYTPENVAAVWFSGQPLGGNNKSDVNGMTAPVYSAKVMKNLKSSNES